jgi:hypothetical protein
MNAPYNPVNEFSPPETVAISRLKQKFPLLVRLTSQAFRYFGHELRTDLLEEKSIFDKQDGSLVRL